jgi:hypothetical protein
MGLGVGIFLLAVGAVLAFAIHVTTNGAINVQVVGYILMAAGALGIVLSMVFWSSWGGFSRRQQVVDPVGGTRTTTIDQR